MSGASAFVAGFTGATGSELVKELGKSGLFSRVKLIGRRTVDLPDVLNANIFEQEVVNYEEPDSLNAVISGCNVGFCCLGTTRRDAGADGFVKVDRDYVLALANCAKAQGCSQFHLVSSQGADKSSYFLYPKTKGEVEASLMDMKFDSLFIYRPPLIVRGDKARGVEKVFGVLAAPVNYFKPGSAKITANEVARAMIAESKSVDAPVGNKLVFGTDISKLASS